MAAGGVMAIVAITGMALGNKAEDDYVASGADLDAVDKLIQRLYRPRIRRPDEDHVFNVTGTGPSELGERSVLR